MKQHSWGLIALIRGLKRLQILRFIKEVKLSGFHWEITTLPFTPSLVNVHSAGFTLSTRKVVNSSPSCY